MIKNLMSKIRKITKRRSRKLTEKFQPSVNLVSGIIRSPSGWDFSVFIGYR